MARIRRGRGPSFAQVPWTLQDDVRTGADLEIDHLETDRWSGRVVDGATIATYAALRRWASHDTGTTGQVASHKRLAAAAGLGVTALKDRLERLEALGWVDVVRQNGRPNEYIVHGELDAEPSREAARSPSREATTPQPPGGHPASIDHSSEGLSDTPEGTEKRTWLTPYLEAHEEIISGRMAPETRARWCKRAAATLRPLEDLHGTARVLPAFRRFLESYRGKESRYLNIGRFADTFAAWDDAQPNGARKADLMRGRYA